MNNNELWPSLKILLLGVIILGYTATVSVIQFGWLYGSTVFGCILYLIHKIKDFGEELDEAISDNDNE